MAAVEKLEYPATGAVTNTFQPTFDAEFQGSDETLDAGVIAEQSSGSKEYRYKEGIQFKLYRRRYRKLPSSDKSAFLTFLNVVLGLPMKFTDLDAATHTVTFANFNFTFVPEEAQRWSWEFTLREEL